MRVTLLAQAAEPSCYSRLTNEWICWQYVEDRQAEIVDATTQHLALTVASVLLGLVIAFPVALLARRLPRRRGGDPRRHHRHLHDPVAGAVSAARARSPGSARPPW